MLRALIWENPPQFNKITCNVFDMQFLLVYYWRLSVITRLNSCTLPAPLQLVRIFTTKYGIALVSTFLEVSIVPDCLLNVCTIQFHFLLQFLHRYQVSVSSCSDLISFSIEAVTECRNHLLSIYTICRGHLHRCSIPAT